MSDDYIDLSEREPIWETLERLKAEQVDRLPRRVLELEERLAKVESQLAWLLRYSSGNLDG